MKIVIDITENEYEAIKEYYENNDVVETIYSYIYHGTPIGMCSECSFRKSCVLEGTDICKE